MKRQQQKIAAVSTPSVSLLPSSAIQNHAEKVEVSTYLRPWEINDYKQYVGSSILRRETKLNLDGKNMLNTEFRRCVLHEILMLATDGTTLKQPLTEKTGVEISQPMRLPPLQLPLESNKISTQRVAVGEPTPPSVSFATTRPSFTRRSFMRAGPDSNYVRNDIGKLNP